MDKPFPKAPLSYDPNALGYSVLQGAPELDTRHKPGHVYTSPEVYELEKSEGSLGEGG